MPPILFLLWFLLLGQGLSGCASLDTSPQPQEVNYQEILHALETRAPQIAKRYYGLPHHMAANPDLVKASDCTHLVCAITRHSLDDTPYRFKPYYIPSAGIMANSIPVNRAELRVGDMIFFHDGASKHIDHAGVIIAKDRQDIRFVHASNIKGVAETASYDTGYRRYWERRFDSFRRWKPGVFSLRNNMLASSQ